MKKLLSHVSVLTAGLCFCAAALAKTDITFYFPVAVGGPITKTIDKYAADFNQQNPDYNVIPVYSGTYQETIVKVLTAHKSGKPPTASIMLSTDTFTLVDEDAIAFIRQSSRESILVVITRKAIQLGLPQIDGRITTVYGGDLSNGVYRSSDASIGIYRIN